MDEKIKPNISIVIPAKNAEKEILFCLQSIKELDYDQDSIEILVIDNGSSDLTVNIAKGFGSNVFIEPTKTIAGLRNVGARKSCGEIICFLDADMIVSKIWLKSAVALFNNKKIGCVTGPLKIPENSSWLVRTWSLKRDYSKTVGEVYWAPSGNMIVRRKSFDICKGFNENLVTGEDFDFSQRLKVNGYLIIFSKDVSAVHTGEYQTLSKFIRKERWRGYSDLDLLFSKNFKISNIRNATQPLFFMISVFFLISALCCFNISFIIFSAFLVALLPLLRGFFISIKHKTVKYIPSLFVVWTIYYIARSLSIIDNFQDRFTRNT